MLAALPIRHTTPPPPSPTHWQRVLLHGFLSGIGPGACPKAFSQRGRSCARSGCDHWRGYCTARGNPDLLKMRGRSA